MEPLVPVVLALMALVGMGSVRVTSSSRSMLVERLGKYNRQLSPGLSLVLPGIERVVSHESLKERVLDIPAAVHHPRQRLHRGGCRRLLAIAESMPAPITPSMTCRRPW
jgi:regulator of protease activity HflC (stomatin/prohibitin superfamily)